MNEIERFKNEIFRHISQENAETTRLKSQETALKSENEILKQKISGLNIINNMLFDNNICSVFFKLFKKIF